MSRFRYVVREEAMRSVAWFVLSMFGWSLIVTASDRVAASTGALLAVGTTVALGALTAGVRLVTDRDLKGSMADAPLLRVIGGGAVVGFGCVYLVAVLGYPAVLLAGYLVAFAAALAAAAHLVS